MQRLVKGRTSLVTKYRTGRRATARPNGKVQSEFSQGATWLNSESDALLGG